MPLRFASLIDTLVRLTLTNVASAKLALVNAAFCRLTSSKLDFISLVLEKRDSVRSESSTESVSRTLCRSIVVSWFVVERNLPPVVVLRIKFVAYLNQDRKSSARSFDVLRSYAGDQFGVDRRACGAQHLRGGAAAAGESDRQL